MKRIKSQYIGWWLFIPALIGATAAFIYYDLQLPTIPIKAYGNGTPVLQNTSNVSDVVLPPLKGPVTIKSTPAPVPKPAGTVKTNSNVLNLINKVRAEAGVHLVEERDDLNQSATRSVHALINSNRCSVGTKCTHGDWQQHFKGTDYKLIGENIAACQTSDELLVRAWVNSPSHYENIVRKDFYYAGVALAHGPFTGDISRGVTIQCRYAVNHFGGR